MTGFGSIRATRKAAVALAAVAVLVASAPARAETLPEVLPDLLKISKKMKSAEADMSAAREKAREALGDWFPKLDLTGSYGYERQFKGNNTADTSIPPREFEAKITQLLWDFGSTNRAIDNARLSFEQARAGRDSSEQTTLLEGIVAYLDLLRRTRILEFSRGSEDNIKRQTELEDARVQRGSGFSTDVLQSKRQLASAQAARVRAEGATQTARNRYLNVYDKLPERPQTMAVPRLPLDLLPATLNEAVDIAGKENPQLKAAKMSAEIARNNVAKTFSDKFAPTINLVGEQSHKNDFDGTIGQKHESMVKVEGKYSFNLGLTAINTLKASQYALTSSENKYGETLDNVQEQTRNAWQELETSKQNLEHLRNEANIAAEFLELARKERALGRRSLIDVLAGETALINASSDAASAETDMAIAVFKLLSAMGRLDLGTVVPSAPKPGGEKEGAPAQAALTPELPAASDPRVGEPGGSRPTEKASAQPVEQPAAVPAPQSVESAPAAASATIVEPAPAAVAPEAAAPRMQPSPVPLAPAPLLQVAGWVAPAAPAKTEKVEVVAPAAPPPAAIETGSVRYLVRNSALRARSSFLAPAVRAVERCEEVQYVQGRDDWVFVRVPASASAAVSEGWIYGNFVSPDRSACEGKRAAK